MTMAPGVRDWQKRVLRMVHNVASPTVDDALLAGGLLASASRDDIVDAFVVVAALRALPAFILTSDDDEIRTLLDTQAERSASLRGTRQQLDITSLIGSRPRPSRILRGACPQWAGGRPQGEHSLRRRIDMDAERVVSHRRSNIHAGCGERVPSRHVPTGPWQVRSRGSRGPAG
jgi:hypothetical protein